VRRAAFRAAGVRPCPLPRRVNLVSRRGTLSGCREVEAGPCPTPRSLHARPDTRLPVLMCLSAYPALLWRTPTCKGSNADTRGTWRSCTRTRPCARTRRTQGSHTQRAIFTPHNHARRASSHLTPSTLWDMCSTSSRAQVGERGSRYFRRRLAPELAAGACAELVHLSLRQAQGLSPEGSSPLLGRRCSRRRPSLVVDLGADHRSV
jgi:hypothetical protein